MPITPAAITPATASNGRMRNAILFSSDLSRDPARRGWHAGFTPQTRGTLLAGHCSFVTQRRRQQELLLPNLGDSTLCCTIYGRYDSFHSRARQRMVRCCPCERGQKLWQRKRKQRR